MCDQIITTFGEKICLDCIDKLEFITPPWCIKCGKKMSDEGEICSNCKNGNHIFTRGRSLYEYESMALSIYRFKYGGRAEYADFYGEEIAEFLGDFISKVNPDMLVPIPLHKSRLRKRGYNQAELIAKSISKYTGIPTNTKVLKRIKNTKPMKMLSNEGRFSNIKRAFIIGQNSVKLKTIIIIDDIYTTGTTIDEATRVMKSAGAADIYFVTLASGRAI